MKLRLMICTAAASTVLFAAEDAISAATYAVMNVTNAYTDTVIAVPWVGLDGSAITISNLVNTTTVAAGDKLYMYGSDGKWYAYTKNAAGNLEGDATISSEGVTITDAAQQTIERGKGLILQRANAGGNVLLCGRVDANTVSTTIAGAVTVEGETVKGKTLFANPTASSVDINTKFTSATNGDTITIPLNNGGSDTYTFNGTEWGKMTVTEQTLPNGRKRKTNAWSKCGSIPAGTGAWYEATGVGYTVTW